MPKIKLKSIYIKKFKNIDNLKLDFDYFNIIEHSSNIYRENFITVLKYVLPLMSMKTQITPQTKDMFFHEYYNEEYLDCSIIFEVKNHIYEYSFIKNSFIEYEKLIIDNEIIFEVKDSKIIVWNIFNPLYNINRIKNIFFIENCDLKERQYKPLLRTILWNYPGLDSRISSIEYFLKGVMIFPSNIDDIIFDNSSIPDYLDKSEIINKIQNIYKEFIDFEIKPSLIDSINPSINIQIKDKEICSLNSLSKEFKTIFLYIILSYSLKDIVIYNDCFSNIQKDIIENIINKEQQNIILINS